MTKTQGVFEKRPRDFYATPFKAATALIGHLPQGFSFCEPCAGAGALVEHLEALFGASCYAPFDIEPQANWITKADGIDLSSEAVQYCDYIITNPPFTWALMTPLLNKWLTLDMGVVLLLPADFMHNVRFAQYLPVCEKIVSIGRVQWIEGSKGAGVENYCWYFFNPNNKQKTEFYGR
jgi:hypothetical protein